MTQAACLAFTHWYVPCATIMMPTAARSAMLGSTFPPGVVGSDVFAHAENPPSVKDTRE